MAQIYSSVRFNVVKGVICEQFIDFLNDALALVQLWEGFSWSQRGPVWAEAQKTRLIG